MKRFIPFIIILFILDSFSPLHSQCVPNTSITVPGIYPDSATGLPAGNVGTLYSEVMQARVPVDTTYNGLPAIINSIDVVSITGLPPGVSYTCTPTLCVFQGGTNGCVLLQGTPTLAGSYPLTVDLMANGTVFGFPVQLPQQLTYYVITINGPLGIPSSSHTKFVVEQNKPNPFSNFTEIKYTQDINGPVELKIYNLLGREVLHKIYDSQKGNNTIKLDARTLTAGVYMYTLSNGIKSETRRMVINKR